MRRNRLWAILFGCFLFAFTSYVLLDTFVIVRKYETVTASVTTSYDASIGSEPVTVISQTVTSASPEPASDAAAKPVPTAEPTETALDQSSSGGASSGGQTATVSTANVVSTDTTYRDDNISITLTTYRISGTTVYVADVALSSPEYLKTAFADNAYGRNVTATTSETADAVNAILAINGDYYGARQSGYVIRSGGIYRSKAAKDAEDYQGIRDHGGAACGGRRVERSELRTGAGGKRRAVGFRQR